MPKIRFAVAGLIDDIPSESCIFSVLGPFGTYSEIVTSNVFGKNVQLVYGKTVLETLKKLDKWEAQFAVIPWVDENLVEIDKYFTDYDDCGVRIGYGKRSLSFVRWIDFDVIYNLFGIGNINDIKTICSHPHALSNCKPFLDKYFPHTSRQPTSSTTEAGIIASKDPTVAAIGPEKLEEKYKLKMLMKDITSY